MLFVKRVGKKEGEKQRRLQAILLVARIKRGEKKWKTAIGRKSISGGTRQEKKEGGERGEQFPNPAFLRKGKKKNKTIERINSYFT